MYGLSKWWSKSVLEQILSATTYICHFPFASSLLPFLPVICLLELYEGVLFVPQLPQVYLCRLPLLEVLPFVICSLALCQHPCRANAKIVALKAQIPHSLLVPQADTLSPKKCCLYFSRSIYYLWIFSVLFLFYLKFLILSSSLRDIFTGYSILGWQVFFSFLVALYGQPICTNSNSMKTCLLFFFFLCALDFLWLPSRFFPLLCLLAIWTWYILSLFSSI